VNLVRGADKGSMRVAIALLAVTTLLAGAQQARADWQEPVGGASPINADAARNAGSVAAATVGGSPHIAWTEDTTQPGQGNSNAIDVARLDGAGTAWTRLAPSSPITRSPTASTSAPSLTDSGGVPWVAWAENSADPLCPFLGLGPNKHVHAARLSPAGDAWIGADDDDHLINRDADGTAENPSIAGSGDRPYVAFWELDPGSGSAACAAAAPAKVWVVRLSADGSTWDVVGGGPVQEDPTRDAAQPDLAIVDGHPTVAYFQLNGANLDARVARLADDGSGWTQVGGVLASGGFGQIEPLVLTGVAGVPTVAVSAAGAGIRVFQPAAGGGGWDQIGGGPVASGGGGPAVADMGGVPWVSWSEGGIRVARLDGGAWRRAGSEIDGGGGAQLASVNGFPWVAFTRDDGSTPGGPGTPGCCSQARVTRLEPTFSSLRAFPAADTATLLSGIDAFGLPYPVSFEYGQGRDGAQIGATPMKPAAGDFVLGEARGLTPATLNWYRPVATAGTPLPLAQGPRDTFATPPASAAGGGPGGTPAPPATVTTRKARFIVAIVQSPATVRRGARVRLRVLSSEPGTAEFTVVRRGSTVRSVTRAVRAGTFTVSWRPRRAPRRYRLRVRVHASDGRTASDAVTLRVLRRRAS
jgi:hypothetical protein